MPHDAENEESRTKLIKKMIPARMDKKFELSIVHSNEKVYVSSVTPGSVAADHFKVKDIILSIMGVSVKDKLHCRDLILLACDSESEFEVTIERPPSASRMPQSKPQEVSEVAELQFHPAPVSAPVVADKKKRHKTKKSKSPPSKLPPPKSYHGFYLGDTEFEQGNPLDGLKFPAPADVREIIRAHLPQILSDSLETPQKKPTPSQGSNQSPKSRCRCLR